MLFLIFAICIFSSSFVLIEAVPPQYAPSSPGCHIEEKTIIEEKCEDYIEKTCITRNERECKQVTYEFCDLAYELAVEKLCFKVDEQICIIQDEHLRGGSEDPYDLVIVGECLESGEIVCDKKFNVESTIKNEHQCADVRQPKCAVHEEVVTDVTCVDSFEFECQAGAYHGQAVCKRHPTRNCSNSNRKVNVDYCEMGVVNSCLSFPKKVYSPVGKEVNCRTVPKPDPSFYGIPCYTKYCIEKSRNICDQYEIENVKPMCRFTNRQVCSYVPKDQCSEKKKQFCTNVERVVSKQVCDGNFIFNYGRH